MCVEEVDKLHTICISMYTISIVFTIRNIFHVLLMFSGVETKPSVDKANEPDLFKNACTKQDFRLTDIMCFSYFVIFMRILM